MFLDSGDQGSRLGRFDIIVSDPVCTLVTRGLKTTIIDEQGERISEEDPFLLIKQCLLARKCDSDIVPFSGGAMGARLMRSRGSPNWMMNQDLCGGCRALSDKLTGLNCVGAEDVENTSCALIVGRNSAAADPAQWMALKRARKNGAKIITVDPARDTVTSLANYVPNFHPRLKGLTGSEAEINAATRAYKVYFKLGEEKEAPDDYPTEHTEIIYLMGPDGEFLDHFQHGRQPAEIAQLIGQYL